MRAGAFCLQGAIRLNVRKQPGVPAACRATFSASKWAPFDIMTVRNQNRNEECGPGGRTK